MSNLIKNDILGKMLYMGKEHLLPVYLKDHPHYDRAISRLAKNINIVEKNLSVMDIGANIGDSADLILRSVPDANIICFEADLAYLEALNKNLEENIKIGQVTVIEKFLGEENINFKNQFLHKKNGTAYLDQNKDGAADAYDTVSIDSLDKKYIENVNFVKIDTDGFEFEIIKGGINFFKNYKPYIFTEFNPLDYIKKALKVDNFIKMLLDCGYETAILYDNYGKIINMINLSISEDIKILIDRIDNKTIYYYDLFLIPKSKIGKQDLIIQYEMLNALLYTYKVYDELKIETAKILSVNSEHISGETESLKLQIKSLNERIEELNLNEQNLKEKLENISNQKLKISSEFDFLQQKYDILLSENEKIKNSRGYKIMRKIINFIRFFIPA